ncbi:hypothetical protein D3C86_1172250 [compost metagenome]
MLWFGCTVPEAVSVKASLTSALTHFLRSCTVGALALVTVQTMFEPATVAAAFSVNWFVFCAVPRVTVPPLPMPVQLTSVIT